MEKRWNPWAALRARPELELDLVALPAVVGGAVYAPQDNCAVILIDTALSRRDRKAALGHELVHHERGGGCPTNEAMPPQWDAVIRREELVVEAEVARRLVPADELRGMLTRMGASELGGASAADIAEHFDVPEDVAIAAVRQLGPSERGRPA